MDAVEERIRPLPSVVVSQIKSSSAITSLNAAILGLLRNSLDAGATRVEISANFGRGNCSVEDDGRGIHPGEFAVDGGLGKMHQTSKHGAPGNLHGQNGTFLASLGSVSLTTVISRHHQYRSTNGITLFRSDVKSRMTPCSESQGLCSKTNGTRVVVRDLFGDMPVRVKQRAVQMDDRIEIDKIWNELKLHVVALMVAWPVAVSIRLVDEMGGRRVTIPAQTSPAERLSPTSTRTWLPHIAKHADLLPSALAQSWIPVSASSRKLAVNGVIALEPAATKQVQFLSIGVRPLSAGSNCEFYTHINKLFSSSSFGAAEDSGQRSVEPLTPKRTRTTSPRNRSRVDRWPMFDLRIILHTDTHADPGSLGQYTVNAITEALGALVSSWLSTHHFKTGSDRNVLRRRGRSNQTKERELSRGIRRHGLSSPLPSLGLKRSFTDDVMTTPSTTSWERDDSQGRPRPAPILNGDSEDERQNEEMLDCPRATRRHTSNLPIHPRPSGASTTSGRISLKTSSTPKKSTPWLDNVLENWKNPVFRSAEEPIPCVNVELSTQEPTRLEVSLFSDVACAAKSHLTNSTLPGKTKLTKEALRLGKVVAQVDSQFILLLVASDPLDAHNLDMLVMVDQHAADERCRVERLFHELCEPAEAGGAVSNLGVRSSIRSTSLPKTISFKLPVQEARHFCAQAGHFAKWGIIYDLETSPDDSTTETLTIKALPTPISQRAAADPPLLISLLRAEMWKVAEHGRGGSSAHPSHDERELHPVNSHGWTRSMAGCPAGIVDMLNSRACRSAVMFNDPLTLDESAAMIARLAACAFPFQCAHGRPSVVPLLRLAEAAPKGGAEGPVEFVEAFRKWKDSEAEERSHDFTT